MGKVLRREGLGAGAGFLHKAEAARSECEGDGAPSCEALFASQEGAFCLAGRREATEHSCRWSWITTKLKNRQLAVF
ncbi:hypothetical protein ABE55_12590 [Bacillus thuringiensis]|nr:hypothetical protein [Bacillus thuringiensis]